MHALVGDARLCVVERRLAAVAAVAMVVLGLSACSQRPLSAHRSGDSSPTTTAPLLPDGNGLTPAAGVLSDRIVLKSRRIASGQSIGGSLLVVNHGGAPINLTKMCRPDFVVALTSSSYTPIVAWAANCSGLPFIIAPGTNRLPLKVITTYLGCSQGGRPSTEPKCTSTGPPPLPTGNYDAVLFGDGLALPKPQPISVTLTKGLA
jgi:hypothetical protein